MSAYRLPVGHVVDGEIDRRMLRGIRDAARRAGHRKIAGLANRAMHGWTDALRALAPVIDATVERARREDRLGCLS